MTHRPDRAEIARATYRAFAAGEREVIESGDEVVVTYEATRVDGSSFRNTEC